MASVREYLERMRSEQLIFLLTCDFDGDSCLPVDLILLICQILQERDPSKLEVRDAFRRFVNYYLPGDEQDSH